MGAVKAFQVSEAYALLEHVADDFAQQQTGGNGAAVKPRHEEGHISYWKPVEHSIRRLNNGGSHD